MPSCAFALHPGSFKVSCLLSEEGNRLFVCLFRRGNFPPELRTVFTSPSLSVPGGPWLYILLKWSVSQLYTLWSSGLTPLHLLAPRVVLSVQSDSSFDPIWFLLRENGLDSPCGCRSSVKLHMGYMKASIWGTDWMCCCQCIDRIHLLLLWGSLQLK